MKKEFYYNNRKIRTSEHDYTHALINTRTGECIGCRTSYKACESFMNTELNTTRRYIANLERRLEAIKEGKSYYNSEFKKGQWTKYAIHPTETVEQAEELLNKTKDRLARLVRDWKIVELEVR